MKKLILALCVLAPSLSPAACKSTSIGGTWIDYGFNYGAQTVGKCTFVMDKYGNIISYSNCVSHSATQDIDPIYITSGSFQVDSNCRVTSNLTGGNGISAFFEGQMDRSKNSIAGISRNNTGAIALHHFVRQ